MTQATPNRYHPRRWTGLTWLAILLWTWEPAVLNYPPSKSYTIDPETGERSAPTQFRSLSEIPFPVGWPMHYVRPSSLAPVWPVGALPAPPVPSEVRPSVLVANLLIVAATVCALIYLLQRFLSQFSLGTLFQVSLTFAALWWAPGLVSRLVGYRVAQWYSDALYFMPLLAAVVVRFEFVPRLRSMLGRRTQVSATSLQEFACADDAVGAATALDRKGDWDAAIEIYRLTARRWPAHARYAQNCIKQIADKQSLVQQTDGAEGHRDHYC